MRPLPEVLCVLPGDPVGRRLVAHIAAYRTQRGYDVTPGHPRQEYRHFFVEPLSDLAVTAEKLARAPASPGGTDDGNLETLYRRKVSQARAASWPKQTLRAACVVRFVEPKALFWRSDEPG